MLNQARHLQLTPSLLPGSSSATVESQALDKEFRRYYVASKLPVARVAIGLGFMLVVAVCILDMSLMPEAFYEEAIPLRIVTMLIPLSALLGATFLFKERTWLPYLIASVALLVGVSILYIGNIALRTGVEMAFWGIVFTTLNVYLVLGLTLRQSVSVGWPIFFIYVISGFVFAAPLQVIAYGALFLGFSNLIGTYASYLLERNAREIFDNRHELMRLTRTDGLTGLFNRRAFSRHLRQVWKQALRDDKHIAIVVADIDHFKLYNDCYGHQKGDECIKNVADALAASVSRPLDMVARYGGEEYVIVLYDPTVGFLDAFVRGLCHKVVELEIEHKGSEATPNVSLSIGAAITEAAGNVTADQLIRQADDALYEAKKQGRNQAVIYRTEWGQQTTAQLAAMLL
ncbi:MAG: diguanylate cyclase [Gammaproteobacteria bacterium]|nr:diguanylate cyclase [Gammaproteobacteria bacterium]